MELLFKIISITNRAPIKKLKCTSKLVLPGFWPSADASRSPNVSSKVMALILREHRMASLSTKLLSSTLDLRADRITHISHRLIFTALRFALLRGEPWNRKGTYLLFMSREKMSWPLFFRTYFFIIFNIKAVWNYILPLIMWTNINFCWLKLKKNSPFSSRWDFVLPPIDKKIKYTEILHHKSSGYFNHIWWSIRSIFKTKRLTINFLGGWRKLRKKSKAFSRGKIVTGPSSEIKSLFLRRLALWFFFQFQPSTPRSLLVISNLICSTKLQTFNHNHESSYLFIPYAKSPSNYIYL